MYSFVLKHVMIVDVLVLSLCYVWRAVAGALAIDVLVSPWLFLCTAFLALFIGFNKRRAELLQQEMLPAHAGFCSSIHQTCSSNINPRSRVLRL